MIPDKPTGMPPRSRTQRSIALIGNGAMATWLCQHLSASPILVRRGDKLPDVEVVVEVAGQQALIDYGARALQQGSDLIVASAGALANPDVWSELCETAEHSRIFLPAGALAGIDALSAARCQGLRTVCYEMRKPPLSLSADLDPNIEQIIFEGNARETALKFPKNANAAAIVALAGVGFERTETKVVADPTVDRNIHTIEASGDFGELSIRVCGRPIEGNVKTSKLAAMSILRCVENRYAAVQI